MLLIILALSPSPDTFKAFSLIVELHNTYSVALNQQELVANGDVTCDSIRKNRTYISHVVWKIKKYLMLDLLIM